jgi:hypothetical protein
MKLSQTTSPHVLLAAAAVDVLTVILVVGTAVGSAQNSCYSNSLPYKRNLSVLKNICFSIFLLTFCWKVFLIKLLYKMHELNYVVSDLQAVKDAVIIPLLLYSTCDVHPVVIFLTLCCSVLHVCCCLQCTHPSLMLW